MSSKTEMLEQMLKKLLADQHFSRLVVVEQEKWTQALQGSHWEEPRVSDEKMASWAQQNLILGTSISISTCGKEKSLDVTLDDLAGFADGSW